MLALQLAPDPATTRRRPTTADDGSARTTADDSRRQRDSTNAEDVGAVDDR